METTDWSMHWNDQKSIEKLCGHLGKETWMHFFPPKEGLSKSFHQPDSFQMKVTTHFLPCTGKNKIRLPTSKPLLTCFWACSASSDWIVYSATTRVEQSFAFPSRTISSCERRSYPSRGKSVAKCARNRGYFPTKVVTRWVLSLSALFFQLISNCKFWGRNRFGSRQTLCCIEFITLLLLFVDRLH